MLNDIMICAANQVLHVVHSKWEAVTSTKVGCTVFYPAVTCPFARKDIQHTYFVSSLTYRSRLFVSTYPSLSGLLTTMLTLTVPEAAASTDEIQFKLVLDGQPPEVLITPI